jgi:hypothetical protein
MENNSKKIKNKKWLLSSKDILDGKTVNNQVAKVLNDMTPWQMISDDEKDKNWIR